jgi:hypothetical protein
VAETKGLTQKSEVIVEYMNSSGDGDGFRRLRQFLTVFFSPAKDCKTKRVEDQRFRIM